MTKARTPASADCAHCGKSYVPVKWGHRFCSIACRHRGEREPFERVPVDEAAVARLFAEDRDPEAPVEPHEWLPPACEPARDVFAVDSVRSRRRWFLALRAAGRA